MKISDHFSDTEFEDSDAGIIPQVHPALLDALELMRVALGRPIMITSGYRSPAHNKAVGGADESFHMTNPLMGVDIIVAGVHPIDVAASAIKWGFQNGGIGVYPTDGHVHLDVRTNGPARWFGK